LLLLSMSHFFQTMSAFGLAIILFNFAVTNCSDANDIDVQGKVFQSGSLAECEISTHEYVWPADGSSTLLQTHQLKEYIVRDMANGETEGEGPQVLTIFDEKYAWLVDQWRTCAIKALGSDEYKRRVRLVNTTAQKQKYVQDASLLQIAPNYLEYFLPRLLREGIEEGQDMIHVDVDAFLLKDPGIVFATSYPEADIVSAVDAAGGRYDWYIGDDYLARHGGEDPLGQRRFMLNFGVILFRSNPRVLAMFDELIGAREAIGATWGDQTLFNEVLLQWNCTWTLADGSPLSSNSSHTRALILKSSLHAACIGNVAQHTGKQLGNLSLVVVPYSTVTRWSTIQLATDPHTVAMHPGWSNKNQGVHVAAVACA